MKPQSADNFILFSILVERIKSQLVRIRCKLVKGVLNWENGQSWS